MWLTAFVYVMWNYTVKLESLYGKDLSYVQTIQEKYVKYPDFCSYN